jgi:STE24 endopeptidase
VNEPKSSRYHRLRRRAGFASLACTIGLLAAMLVIRPALPVAAYVLLLALLYALLTLPIAYYRSFLLDHRYELSSEPAVTWFRDHLKGLAIGVLLALAGAETVYFLIAWNERWWWVAAAGIGTLVTLVFVRLAPVVLLPLFFRFTPLERPALSARLLELSRRAGVPVLGAFEWGLGAKTRRANAALVGAGATRRILLSDTLLAEYTDDEVEVILAHELGHHVHHDIAKGIILQFVLLLASAYAASVAISSLWLSMGFRGPADPAAMPVLLFAAGTVMLVATPLVNAMSRFNERSADRFALTLTHRHDAFVSAMRRLGAQNLAEESPSRASVWLFHTHPPIEERIAAAREGRHEGGQAP